MILKRKQFCLNCRGSHLLNYGAWCFSGWEFGLKRLNSNYENSSGEMNEQHLVRKSWAKIECTLEQWTGKKYRVL